MTKLVTRTVVQGSLTENTAVEASTDALTHAELDKNFYPIAIPTNGTAVANKALVLDVNSDMNSGINDFTVDNDLTVGNNLAVTGNISYTPRGGLVTLTSSQTTSNSTITELTGYTAVYDTDSIYTTGARLTVPSGVTKVRVQANIMWNTSSLGHRGVFIYKNGLAFSGNPISYVLPTTTNTYQNLSSPIIEVTAGDYFSVFVIQTSGGNLSVSSNNNNTWFSMEIIS